MTIHLASSRPSGALFGFGPLTSTILYACYTLIGSAILAAFDDTSAAYSVAFGSWFFIFYLLTTSYITATFHIPLGIGLLTAALVGVFLLIAALMNPVLSAVLTTLLYCGFMVIWFRRQEEERA